MLVVPRGVELGGDGREVEEDRIQVIIKDASIAGLEWDLSGDHTVKWNEHRLLGQLELDMNPGFATFSELCLSIESQFHNCKLGLVLTTLMGYFQD